MAEARFTFAAEVRPVCEIGMSATRTAEPSSWLDVSCYVHQAELFRGRERFNERFEPGTASVTFTNDGGWADLGGTYVEVAAAPLRPGRPVRIGVHGPWTPGLGPFVRWLYRGYIDQATPAYDPVAHDVVTINCIDALGESGSSVAPTAAMQGINETVSARINRVLDAVGWYGTKRKIDASLTKVQGTTLGSSAIDHMGQAADSAGGVVFGDLDGDVVFKDIDWMLYDPDLPPDGGIGNGPGGGGGGAGPGSPPYIDPSEGPVYDPDDPPAVTPPKVCVCADGTAGTLVEKGDNYRLYVKGGHLFYESSGTTWDLGPYSGGCACVEPPNGGPPVRTDPENPTIPPITGTPMPPVFAVELLGYSDANSDEVVSAVTVGGIHPGHDCLLVVMVNAIADTTNTAGLVPVVTGGGLDWAHRRDVDRIAYANATIAAAAVGRTDPGTFSVVSTWHAGQTSRTHIVTVWKVTAAANDYLERFDAGAILYALTATNPPELITPGNGPATVPLLADRQPSGVPAASRDFDITIAQSLADDEHGPYGASFDTATGPWTEVPMTASVLAAGDPWSDDFERANGPLGTNWVLDAGTWWSASNTALTIVSGAAEGTAGSAADGTYRSNIMRWHEAQGAGQAIEALVQFPSTAGSENQVVHLLTNMTEPGVGTWSAEDAFCFFNSTTELHVGAVHTSVGIGVSVDVAQAIGVPFVLRLESDPDGTNRVLLNGTVVLTHSNPGAVAGPYVGLAIDYFTGETSPRILQAGGAPVGRKASWVAGWRQGVASSVVGFSDVNFGDEDNQSTQSALVLEPADVTAGVRVLGYGLRALSGGLTPAGTFALNSPPRPGSLVVVFVGLTDEKDDTINSVSVTGADFIRGLMRPQSGTSWGQGAVWSAVAPIDLNESSWNILVTYPDLESISVVAYEVTVQDDTAPIGAVASNTLGTNVAGSVNGASTITLTAAGDAAATVLAFIHVSANPSGASGASPGSGWVQGLNYSPDTQRGYVQTMTRPSGSTSTAVAWADVQTGSASAYSAVQLAVEVHPYDGIPTTPGGSGVALGGVTDPWNGIIRSAGGYNPDGTAIWEFPGMP